MMVHIDRTDIHGNYSFFLNMFDNAMVTFALILALSKGRG